MNIPTLRITRPTDDLVQLLRFYRDGLGLSVLGEFKDHAGFDGIMLGQVGAPYHLEFTTKRGHSVGRAPSQDNLLVFYYPHPDDCRSALTRMREAGFSPVRSFNPYWDVAGVTFEDPDGYRAVLQNSSWPAPTVS